VSSNPIQKIETGLLLLAYLLDFTSNSARNGTREACLESMPQRRRGDGPACLELMLQRRQGDGPACLESTLQRRQGDPRQMRPWRQG
jgi:hypothetical protein